jgi:subtilisin
MKRLPAYSSAFTTDAIRPIAPLAAFERISREWAWGNSSGKGVKVAVIDSGIDADHAAVQGVQGYVSITETPEGMVYDTAPHGDVYGHGTACAGIIRSFAPECDLYSVRVLGPTLMGRGAIFAAGVRWAIDHGMHVCNMSLGTTKKDFFGILHELTDLAYFRNTMLITAANNMPRPSFPSVYASVIAVASHEVQDAYHYYYNPHPPVEFGAHGIDVHVPWKDGGWITATGNSFAAPHIAGLVTRILANHPGLTVFEMKSLLRGLAANATSVASTGFV